MSADLLSGAADPASRVRTLLTGTLVAVRGALYRSDGRATALVTAAAYLAFYLYGLGHLGLGPSGFDLTVVADPLSRATQLRALSMYLSDRTR